ncbi:hypothetical protein BGX24_002086 [Mortierella sp. AD032]|nr:hypothetical protein BGX24_002086 [Mortierella sp. AD032]
MPLPNPWTGENYGNGFPITLHREQTMNIVSNIIREKSQWWKDPIISARWKQEIQTKIHENPEISAKWKQEIEAAGLKQDERYRLGDKEVEFVFRELEWFAEKRQEQVDSGKEVTIDVGVEGTRRADRLIPEALKQRLVECVKKLEDVPDHLKDWHPGSNHQVLDLVHPSLFPFVAGRTRVTKDEAIPALESIGAGEIMGKTPIPEKLSKIYYSDKLQWLPTNFDVTPEGKVKA